MLPPTYHVVQVMYQILVTELLCPPFQVVSGRQQIHLASLEKSFTFDYAYGTATEQEEVYSSSVKVKRISQKSTITF